MFVVTWWVRRLRLLLQTMACPNNSFSWTLDLEAKLIETYEKKNALSAFSYICSLGSRQGSCDQLGRATPCDAICDVIHFACDVFHTITSRANRMV